MIVDSNQVLQSLAVVDRLVVQAAGLVEVEADILV